MIRRLAVLLIALPLFADSRANVERGLLPVVPAEGEAGMEIRARMQHYGIPGVSIAVWKNGKIDWTAGYGNATAKTMFQAGSISKSLAAVATLRVLARHGIPLETEINAHLTSWQLPPTANRPPPTIATILNHSAGLNVPGFPGFERSDRIPSLIDELEGRGNTQPLRVVGDTFYSGGGYLLLQQLLMDLEHKPIEQILEREVLRPAGMRDASFAATVKGAASGVSEEGDPIPGGSYIFPEKTAAGLWTTAADVARFVIALQTNRLLPPDQTQRMLAENFGVFPFKSHYFAHPGGNTGFVALYVANRTRPEGVAVLANSENADPLLHEIVRAVAKEYGWPDYVSPAVKIAKVDTSGLAGRRYALDRDDVLHIRPDGAQLIVTRTANEPVRLDAVSETEFIDRASGLSYTFIDDKVKVGDETATRTREAAPFDIIGRDAKTGVIEYTRLDPPLLTEERLRARGVALRKSGNNAAALELLQYNADLHKESAAALDALATTQLAAGKVDEARATSQRVLDALAMDWSATASWRQVYRKRAERRLSVWLPGTFPRK